MTPCNLFSTPRLVVSRKVLVLQPLIAALSADKKFASFGWKMPLVGEMGGVFGPKNTDKGTFPAILLSKTPTRALFQPKPMKKAAQDLLNRFFNQRKETA
ncbi:hypothetical protein AALA21_00720 [Eggerthellaceae bacterium 3-80]|nr:hypothetical protein D7W09_01595 [bacterium D16-34]